MNRDELQGVIAHEMSHVRNLDIRKMTLVAALLGAVLLLSDWATRLRLGHPGRPGLEAARAAARAAAPWSSSCSSCGS